MNFEMKILKLRTDYSYYTPKLGRHIHRYELTWGSTEMECMDRFDVLVKRKYPYIEYYTVDNMEFTLC